MQNYKNMIKHTKIFLVIVMLIAGGAFIGYAAFPVSSKGSSTTAIENYRSENTNTVSQQGESKISETTMKTAQPDKGGHHKSGKSQVTALILCILVGAIGIHRFYLGYTWQGIVQLLTLGACGIWSLIDLIRIITGSLEPKHGKYDKTL